MHNSPTVSNKITDSGISQRAMMEKRQRKIAGIEATVSPPKLSGRTRTGVRHDVHTDGAEAFQFGTRATRGTVLCW